MSPKGLESFTLFVFYCFLCFSQVFSCFFSVPFIGFPITSQNVNKKSQEFPLGGHSRCSKTGLAPCRQCSFSSFCFFSHVFFWPNLQIQTPKSKIQNQTSKITHQKNETVLRKHYHFSFCFIIVFFAVHWISHHVPKRQQNSREFPLRGPSPCGKTGLAPCRQCTYSSFLLFFSPFVFFCVCNLFLGWWTNWTLKSRLARFNFKTQHKKIQKWKSPNKNSLCCYCCYASRSPFGTAAALTTVTAVTKIPNRKIPKSKNEKIVPTTFRWYCALRCGPHCCGWHIFFSFFDLYLPYPNPESQIQNSRLRNPNSKTPKSKNPKSKPQSNIQTPKSKLQNQNPSKTPKSKIQNPNPQIQNPRWEDLKGLKFKANRPAFASRHRSRISSSHFSAQKWDKEQHQHDDVWNEQENHLNKPFQTSTFGLVLLEEIRQTSQNW